MGNEEERHYRFQFVIIELVVASAFRNLVFLENGNFPRIPALF